MLKITLADGSIREFPADISGLEIANQISLSLRKKAIAAKVNGKLQDLDLPITEDCHLEIITPNSEDGLEIIRHDTAHLMAHAVKELYPQAKVTIGPVIENGFYYDFDCPVNFTPEDLEKITDKMKQLSSSNMPITRQEMTRSEAIEFFASQGENYKVELIEQIPENEKITLYTQGNFTDLCRGPHSPNVGRTKAFKLLKVAGAYWRGDSKNKMLQRIYGTAWATEEELNAYLTQQEEAQKRDHRKIGKEMGLFHFQEEAPGAVFWHPKGWTIFQELVNYMRNKHNEAGYQEISTPEMLDLSLWRASGHAEKFIENMFRVLVSDEDREYAVKPMNCPGCVQVYKQGVTSYRDLPIRLAEFGKVHRYEASGALHGLMRVRAFTQDDAHIMCTLEQMNEESLKVCHLVQEIYKDFGFNEIKVKFSDRPAKRIGSDEVWDKAEAALKESAKLAGLNCQLNPGEGAFYGPKLEFVLRDAIGRDWQLGTLQVDLNLPERLGAHYIGEDGAKHNVVLLHRAIFGSLERFIGILLEHYAGKLPLWLAPVQAVVTTITNDVDDYARLVSASLRKAGIRHELDLDSEKISYKIRKHALQKIPYTLVIGKSERENSAVSIRKLGSDEQKIVELNTFIANLKEEIAKLKQC
jgi:threonyl-tRNA synthetase